MLLFRKTVFPHRGKMYSKTLSYFFSVCKTKNFESHQQILLKHQGLIVLKSFK